MQLQVLWLGINRTRSQAHAGTTSVTQSVERWSRDPGSRVQFLARGLGVAFFATSPGWALKFISLGHSNLPYFKKPSYVLILWPRRKGAQQDRYSNDI